MKTWLSIVLTLAFLLTCSCAATAGQLDDFEKASTRGKTANHDSDSSGDDDEPGFWDEFFGELFGDMFNAMFTGAFEAIAHGGRLSHARIEGSNAPEFKDVPRRETGSPELPFARADVLYHLVESDIEGFEGRVEAGYGPFGLQFRSLRLKEESPRDSLTLTYVHALYRISGSGALEVDAGIGSLAINGESLNSGASVTFPVTFSPHPSVSIRLVPTFSDINGNAITDYCGSISYVRRFFSFSLGYERIEADEDVLQGPFAGFSMFY